MSNIPLYHLATVVSHQRASGGSDIYSFCENKEKYLQNSLDLNPHQHALLRSSVLNYALLSELLVIRCEQLLDQSIHA